MTAIAPGHGEILEDPYSTIDWIIGHRLDREEKVLRHLRLVGTGTAASLVGSVYDDVDSSLHPIATASLEAHLIKLSDEMKIRKSKGTYLK